MDATLPSHPESYRQIIRRSLILYYESLYQSLLFAFLLALIVFIPRILLDLLGEDRFFQTMHPTSYNILVVLIDILAMLFSISIYWHMHCVIRKRHEPIAEDFKRGAKKVIHVFLGTILQGLIVGVVALIVYGILYLFYHYHFFPTSGVVDLKTGRTLFLIFVCIGQFLLILYVSTLFIFLVPIVVIENKGVFHALEKSATLVWNHWWRTLSVQATPWLVYLLLLLIIRFVFNINIHLYFLNQGPHSVLTTLLNLILFTLFVPWIAGVTIMQLRDLELRKVLEHKAHESKPRRKKRT